MSTHPAPRCGPPPAPEPDEALVLRARAGDTAAFAALVRRWQGAAYARADANHLNGIDRWLGGVHLRGDEAAWRRDDEDGRLRRMD